MISNKQYNFTPQGTSKKGEQANSKVSRRKERTIITVETIEIEAKKTIEKVSKTKSYF